MMSGTVCICGNLTNNFSYADINPKESELYLYYPKGTVNINGTYSTPLNMLTLGGKDSCTLNLQLDTALVVQRQLNIVDNGITKILNHSIQINGNLNTELMTHDPVISSVILLKGDKNGSFIGTSPLSIPNLVIGKMSGAKFYLEQTINVATNLKMDSGVIVTSDASLIQLRDNATVTGGGNTSYVEGQFSKVGNDSFLFPVGKNGVYNPISISAPSSTSDVFVAEYFDEPSSVTDFNSPLTYIDPCEHWNLEHDGSSSANITLGWDNPCFHIASLSYFKVSRDSSSKWVSAIGSSTTGTTTTGTITTTSARSTWGNVTLAKTNPLVIANAGNDTAICYGQSVTLGGSPTGSGGTGSKTYSWSPSNGLSSSTATNPVATPIETTTYIVTVTDAITEFTNDTVEVIVNPAFTVDAGNDQTICVGQEVVLGNSNVASGGTPLYAFNWYNPDTVYSREMYVDYYPANTDTFILVVMDSTHCYASDTVNITVHPAVSVSAFTDTIIPFKGGIVLGGSPTLSGGTAPYHIRWEPSDFLDDTTIANPTLSDLINTVVYNLYVSDSFGCYATTDVNVHPDFPEADSSMHFSLLSGGNITVTDSSYVFEKVGAYGTISGPLVCSDSVWDSTNPVLSGALNDLDSLMTKIDGFAKDTITSDLAASGLRTTGIYFVEDSAVIDGDWTITGDASSMYIICIEDSLIINTHSRIILDGISPSQIIIYANKTISSYGFSDLSGIFISREDITLDSVACPAAFRTSNDIYINAIFLNRINEIQGRPATRSLLSYNLSAITCNLDQDGNGLMDYWGSTIENYSGASATDLDNDGLPDGDYGGYNNPMLFRSINRLHPGYLELHLDESWDWNNEWYSDESSLLYNTQSPDQLNKSVLPEYMIPYTISQRPPTIHNRQTDFKFSLDGCNAKAALVFNFLGPTMKYNFKRLNQALQLGFKINYVVLGNEPYGTGVHQNFFYQNPQQYLKEANRYLDAIHSNPTYSSLGIKVGIFAQPYLDYLSTNIVPQMESVKCKGNNWNSQIGLPNTCPNCATNLHLNAGDGLCFHISPTSGLHPQNSQKIPISSDIPFYFRRVYESKNVFSNESLKILPGGGIEAWVTAYSNTEEDVKISGTWAQGLFTGLFTMLLMEDIRITKLAVHTMVSDFNHAMFFYDNKSFKGNLSPDVDIVTKQWGMSAPGLVLSEILEAMHDATLATEYTFTNPPLILNEFPAIAGWQFDGNGQTEAVFINVSNLPYTIYSPFTGTGQVYEQIYPADKNPLVYCTGDELTAYRIYDNNPQSSTFGNWVTKINGQINPNNGQTLPVLTISPMTSFNPSNPIMLKPYSITRIKLKSTVSVLPTSAATLSTSIDVVANAGNLVDHTGVRLMGRGAASYSWSGSGLLGRFGPGGLIVGSTVIASPTITTTYVVTGYKGAVGTSPVLGTATCIVAPSPITNPTYTVISGTDLGSDVISRLCDDPAAIAFTCSIADSFWISPTEGVYKDASCTIPEIAFVGPGPTTLYFKPLITTEYLITAINTANGKFSFKKITIRRDKNFDLLTNPASTEYCAGNTINLQALLNNAANSNYNYNWYDIEDHNSGGGNIFTQLNTTTSNINTFSLPSTNGNYPNCSTFMMVTADYTGTSGCSSRKLFDIKDIIVVPDLQIDRFGSVRQSEYCEGASVTIQGNDGADYHTTINNNPVTFVGTYTWSNDQSWTGTTSGGSHNYSLTMPNGSSGTSVIVTYTGTRPSNAIPCASISSTDFVKFGVLGLPPTISLSPTTVTVYEGCPVTLTASIPGVSNETFQWFPTEFLSSPVGSSVICTPVGTGATQLHFYATTIDTSVNHYGCCNYAEVTVNVTQFNSHIINGPDPNPAITCMLGERHYLVAGSATAPAGTTYQWHLGNGTAISGAINAQLDLCISSFFSQYYYCTITIPGGCIFNSETVHFSNLPIILREEDQSQPINNTDWNIFAYPNPTEGNLFIRLANSDDYGNLNLEMFDLTGKKLASDNLPLNKGENHYTIHIPEYIENGLYLIRLWNSKHQSYVKLIVQNQ